MLQTLSNQIGIEMLAELAQVPEAAAKTLSKELSGTFSFLFLTENNDDDQSRDQIIR
jgi:hypothetical protein